MQEVEGIIQQVTETLGAVASSDAVVGAPIEVGNVTVVTISRVMAGFGGGGGEGKGAGKAKKSDTEGSGAGAGGGSGGGAVVRPVAVIAFTKNGVKVMPIPEKQGKLEKFLDQLPGLIERFSSKAKEND